MRHSERVCDDTCCLVILEPVTNLLPVAASLLGRGVRVLDRENYSCPPFKKAAFLPSLFACKMFGEFHQNSNIWARKSGEQNHIYLFILKCCCSGRIQFPFAFCSGRRAFSVFWPQEICCCLPHGRPGLDLFCSLEQDLQKCSCSKHGASKES